MFQVLNSFVDFCASVWFEARDFLSIWIILASLAALFFWYRRFIFTKKIADQEEAVKVWLGFFGYSFAGIMAGVIFSCFIGAIVLKPIDMNYYSDSFSAKLSSYVGDPLSEYEGYVKEYPDNYFFSYEDGRDQWRTLSINKDHVYFSWSCTCVDCETKRLPYVRVLTVQNAPGQGWLWISPDIYNEQKRIYEIHFPKQCKINSKNPLAS